MAAYFAWRTYEAARQDREVARLQPVVREMQALAQLRANCTAGGVTGKRERQIEPVGEQARLRVSLDLLPDPLLQTRLLVRLSLDDLVETGQIDAARRELSEAMQAISPAFGPLWGPLEPS